MPAQRNCSFSRSVRSYLFRPHESQPTRLPCPWGFSRQEYRSELPWSPPGDDPNQGSNLGLPHCRQILYHLSLREASKETEAY